MITDLSLLDLNKKYSYADYLQWQFEETVELIQGKIAQMSPAPKRIHQKVSGCFFVEMAQYFNGHPCEFYAAPFDVRFPKQRHDDKSIVFTVVQPDICVICDLTKLDENGCNGAPDLVVEITSKITRQRDFHDKFELYQEAGVYEYWIVEPLERVIYQNHLEGGRYRMAALVGEGEILKSLHFAGLEIPVSQIFQ